MVELTTVLDSDEVPSIKQGGNQVIDNSSLPSGIETFNVSGIPVPIVESADAGNNTIYFDPTAGQVRYKTASGILLRFRMQTV